MHSSYYYYVSFSLFFILPSSSCFLHNVHLLSDQYLVLFFFIFFFSYIHFCFVFLLLLLFLLLFLVPLFCRTKPTKTNKKGMCCRRKNQISPGENAFPDTVFFSEATGGSPESEPPKKKTENATSFLRVRNFRTTTEINLASRWEGVRLPRASGKPPDFPGSSPNFPGSFSATSPEVLSL